MAIESVNPATGERERVFEALSPAAIDDKLASAHAAFADWRRRPVGERGRIVARAGEILSTEKEAFGKLMTREMGKLVGAAEAEAEKCASGCRYYAENAEQLLRPEEVAAELRGGRNQVY